ncbi:hypothetical protein KHC33_08890 [Methanospirillum sp. J.3.6.1-F.2.7.3]|jgi:hypothetical protein|uniref:Uncharacterized protein n=2 Tax=Methanospirillum TaxID=2202 RepID=A0A8E7EG61_9EURY|nr:MULTISPECIES: hypothetical protein [Methanospirillum]MDX8550131.1 hypothetical protein [Methanospirillum hungatei]QVV87492.1 hypothetical protein KHC33_08890 [Methanospirillum sp. J.3.6.1-F.2.7.3]QXO94957.1 hypothetical protein KSK55_00620 [Methanospirillum hungatei]
MKYLNIRMWGPFYILGLLLVLYIMWTVEEIRPQGLALFLGTFLVLIMVGLNFYIMYSEIKAHEDKVDKNRELSGLDPIPKKKGFLKK